MNPQIGAVVRFHATASDFAAIVTAVNADGTLQLYIIPPGVDSTGCYPADHVEQGTAIGQWSA